MKPTGRLNSRLLLPAAIAFLILEFVFAGLIFFYFPRFNDLRLERGTAAARVAASRLEGLLIAGAGLDAIKARWRNDCDIVSSAVLNSSPADTAVGIFRGSSPICLRLRLSTVTGDPSTQPAVLNPESLAALRKILADGSLVAVLEPPEWPGLVAIASALDAEGDETALLLRVVPLSLVMAQLSVPANTFMFRLVNKAGLSLGSAVAVSPAAAGGSVPKASYATPTKANDVFTGTTAISGTNLAVEFLTPAKAATDGPAPLWRLFVMLTALVAAGVLAAASILDRAVVSQLDTIKRVARVYSRGRYSVRFRPTRQMPREILNLGLALNDMASNSSRQARALQETAAEEHRLLLELHHRVKNNFQVVESLLSLLKKGRLPEHVVHLRFVEDHVRSMAVADRVAYGAHGTNVPVDELISGVVDGLRTAAGLSVKQVRLELTLPLGTLDLDRAVPLCLCLSVVLPAYFVALAAEADAIHIAARLQAAGMIRLSVRGAVPDAEPAPFLRQRLVQAYLKQLDAAEGSGWDVKERQQEFRALIPSSIFS